MSTPTARLLLLPFTAALATLVALLLADSSERALGTGPYIPPDCFVADEPSPNGPAAPSDLLVNWSPYYVDGILLDATETVQWRDNSGDEETCFVIERKFPGGDFEVFAVREGCTFCDFSTYSYITGYGTRTYRVYAATATARSEYSEEVTLSKPAPTPSPTPSPSPAGCQVSGEPSPGGPLAPTNLDGDYDWISFYDAEITLTWADNSDDEACFVVERGNWTVPQVWTSVAVVPANSTSVSLSPYGMGEAWHFRVYAASASGRSNNSNDVTIGIPYVDQTFTPTPPATPTPTPSPTPYPRSTIDIRYVSNGSPVEIWVSHFLLVADGVPCPQGQIGAVVKNDRFIMPWPLDDGSLPSACLKGPPTSIELQINGRILVEVEWTGADISQDVEVPLDMIAVPSITPSQQPNLTPAQLPSAGGGPPTGSGIRTAVVLVVIGVIAVALSLLVARRLIQ